MTRVRFCWAASCRAGRSSVTHIPRLVFALSGYPTPIRSKRTEHWCRRFAVSPSECGSNRRVYAAFTHDRRNPGTLLIASWPGFPPLFAALLDGCERSRSRRGIGVRLGRIDLFNRRASWTGDPSGPPATVGGRSGEKHRDAQDRDILVPHTPPGIGGKKTAAPPATLLSHGFPPVPGVVVLTAQESDRKKVNVPFYTIEVRRWARGPLPTASVEARPRTARTSGGAPSALRRP